MGLNKLFRRFTLGNSNYINKTNEKQNDCTILVKKANKENHNLNNKKKLSFSTFKSSKKSIESAYPSCPTLSVLSNNKNNDFNNSCCVSTSSSSSSLSVHQKKQKNSKCFLRLKRSTTINPIANIKKRSWILSRGNSSTSNTNNFVSNTPSTQLPENLFLKCIDQINNPFELCRLKSLNSTIYQHIQKRLEKVIEIDMRKIKFETITIELAEYMQSLNTNIKTFMIDGNKWYIHRQGCKVLMRFANNGTCIKIIVDDSWTSKDVALLHNIMEVFRKTLQTIILDAPIFELVKFFYFNINFFFKITNLFCLRQLHLFH